jgi:hypothetical protein
MILDESVPMVLDRPLATFEQHDVARMTTKITGNEDHPLAGLSPQRRTQERIDAIASILARLALKASSKEMGVST